MKKLIEKLEVLKRVSPSLSDWGEGYTSGVMDALQLVKAHNPWIGVSEELPPAMDKDGFQIAYLLNYKGFCWVAYHNEVSWYDESNQEYITRVNDTDAKWAYLPEVQP